jgi:hypothetical protein
MINISNEKRIDSFQIIINEKEFSFSKPHVTGEQILEKAGLTPVQCYTLYQKLKGCDFTKIDLDEEVDLSNPGIEHFVTKEPETFNYHVNKEPETTGKKYLTPVEILKQAGINSEHSYLVQINDDGSETELAYKPEEKIKMLCTGLKFITRHWLHEVNIEDYGKTCKPVPPALTYKVRVDKSYINFPLPITTGVQLLTKASKLPVEKYDLFKIVSSNPQPQKIHDLHAPINLREECLVRFVTLPKEQQDGEQF